MWHPGWRCTLLSTAPHPPHPLRRSLLEPIRTANPFVSFFEACCEQLDVERKVALCTSVSSFEDGRRPQFEVPYDLAVVAVGELPATFGVPGVEQHCYFMKAS